MAHCDCCDLDLDEIERFCPGCGAPRPRTKVVDVSTTLRESFHAASGDGEAEYAFGAGRQAAKVAPPRVKAAAPKALAAPPKPKTAPPPPPQAPAEPEPEPEVEAPVDEVPPEPPVSEREPEAEPLTTQGDPVVVEPEPEPEAEPAIVREPMPEPSIAAEAAPVEDVDEVDDAGSSPTPEREVAEPVPVASAPDPVEFKPYVVLPPRRKTVAVQVLSPAVHDEAEEIVEVPRRRGRMVLVLVVVLALLGGGAYVLAGREPVTSTNPFTADATDRSISLDAPGGWRIESRGIGVVGIGEPGHDLHVHATAIRRSALTDGLSLKRRAQDVHVEFLASLKDADASRPESVKIGPNPAIRQVLSTGSATYVHTVAKTPKYFVNVLAWTPAERFNQEQGDLLSVVGTLQSSS